MIHLHSSSHDGTRPEASVPSRAALRLANFVAVALIGAAQPSRAEPAARTPVQADLTELSLEALSNLKVQRVYGASKHEQATTEAPSAVSIVSRQDIQEFGYRTLTDIMRSVRGFYATYDRKYTFLGADGFNLPGDFGGRTLVMIDGHRINDPLFDSNFAGTEFPLDVDLIDRVEVIRGPGSSLYGNNAFFAVINVVTRRSQDIHGAEVSGSVADDEGYKGRFTYGQTFSNGVSLTLGTEFRWDPQLEMNNWDDSPAAVWLDISRKAETVGLNLQEEITVCTNLILNAGVRYDWFSFFGDTADPRGALIYSPWSATTLKFIYGQAP